LFYTDIEKSIPEFCRVLKNNGVGIISFDISITNLDNQKVFHKDSLEHLDYILKKQGAQIEFLSNLNKRIDKEPFKHMHEFYKILFRKTNHL
jgi:ubiquinone/menaquinone biosynthesis C-methylase UbiE